MSFFLTEPDTPDIYTLSLHDALPIRTPDENLDDPHLHDRGFWVPVRHPDRKSTRLNSSHRTTSYAVFCLKKKNNSLARRHNCNLTITTAASGVRTTMHEKLTRSNKST